MANFQKDGLWIQGGQGLMENVSEDTPYVPGQVGKVLSVKTTDGKVPRFYQYVKRYTTETNAAAAGAVAYWQDIDDFVVTADVATALGGTTNPVVAGVWLGTSPAAGKYGFIQVGGLATVNVTDTTKVGDHLFAQTATYNQLSAVNGIATDTLTNAANLFINAPRVAIALSAVDTSTNSAISARLDVFRNGW